MSTGESLSSAPAPDAGADIKAVPVRRPGRIVAAILIAVLAALKKLIDGGQYEAILKKWGLENGAIDNPQINGAID